MIKHYKLVGKEIVECSVEEAWVDRDDPAIDRTTLLNCTVSTVFLVVDHKLSLSADASPVLFETAVFKGDDIEIINRYCTYDEAMQGHAKVCQEIENDGAKKKRPKLKVV